jgi:DNA polymerase III epsilon subunit-like protein
MICFFDTETTGLPKNWRAPMRDLDNWPRCIQLAWLITDNVGHEISRANHLILPDGWAMPTDPFWQNNAFTQENSILNGKPIYEVLTWFIESINKCHSIVSHNMSFDYNIVGAEMLRTGIRAGHILAKYCTKEIGTDVCRIRQENGRGYKWPKLSELHHFLFAEDFEGAHDALADVFALKKCFFELVRRDVIVLGNIQTKIYQEQWIN